MGPDGTRLEAWRAFLRAHVAVTESLERELLEARDLPLSWYDVLLNLHEAGGALRMQELADAVLLSKSGLSRLVDRMVGAGLVERRPCADDRRGTLAVLTDEGRRTLRRAAPVHLRGIDEHFAALLSAEEAEVLRSVLERIATAARSGARG